ncbi:DUF5333 domain-containing protein [Citreimonas salinaria]|uniref:NADH dehydrogenase subunit E n=1 Tax=Citreimonas salinaria TaxID=321339 RepID=A0A1H3GWL7_9RHOB|nr:DUF5333 domain-containing protein [Citreimonas salinaria]SDY07460.1 hypothetical protein SAMN05444340_10380 [Citreimonas salinaria]
MFKRLTLPLLVAAALAAPVQAQSKPPLSQVPQIDDALMVIAVADDIRKRCDGIGARMVRAYITINNLKSQAQSLGYSDQEIDDYVTSKEEKARMKRKALAWLAAQGVDGTDTEQLCRFGQRQIDSNSAIGRLLH